MKINLARRHVLALAAVKLLAVGAAFALPSLTPSLFPAAIAAPVTDGSIDAAPTSNVT